MEEAIRIDKWLWAARFFKSRSQAAEAVSGGKVHINGQRVKAGKTIQPGDELSIRKGPFEWAVMVRELSIRRGPAVKAQKLYEETEESRERRSALAEQLRAQGQRQPFLKGRPTKKARRQLDRFTRGDR